MAPNPNSSRVSRSSNIARTRCVRSRSAALKSSHARVDSIWSLPRPRRLILLVHLVQVAQADGVSQMRLVVKHSRTPPDSPDRGTSPARSRAGSPTKQARQVLQVLPLLFRSQGTVHVLRIHELLVDLTHKVAGHKAVMRPIVRFVKHQVRKNLQLRLHQRTPRVSSANNKSWYSALAPCSWVAPFPNTRKIRSSSRLSVTVTLSQSLYLRGSSRLTGMPRTRSFISRPSYFSTSTNLASPSRLSVQKKLICFSHTPRLAKVPAGNNS